MTLPADNQPGATPPDQSPRRLLLMAIVIEGGMGLVGYLIARWLGVDVFARPFAPWQTLAFSFAGTIPLLLIIALLYRYPPRWLEEINKLLDRITPLFEKLRFSELALICALAGIGEELLFRAAFQNLFVDAFGLWVGLIFGSILFGMFHALTRAYFILATIMGLYLGGIYAFTGDLILVMLIHGLYDLGVFLMILRSPDDKEAMPIEPAGSSQHKN